MWSDFSKADTWNTGRDRENSMKALVAAAAIVTAAAGFAASAQAAGDAAKGEKVFNRCKACHAVGEGAKNKVGPILNNTVGNKSAHVEDYKYSKLAVAAHDAGLEWTEENLMAYLEDPSAFLTNFVKEKGGTPSGKSKMTYKLKNEGDRADVIAYLAQFK